MATTGDMHSVNKVNFAILSWFGPRFTNLNDQLKELYCADDLALCSTIAQVGGKKELTGRTSGRAGFGMTEFPAVSAYTPSLQDDKTALTAEVAKLQTAALQTAASALAKNSGASQRNSTSPGTMRACG